MSDTLHYDNEYSRLIGAIGKQALEKLQANSVLISGMKGLGVEIAKNLALMGVKKLTIHDTEAVRIRDLSANFFLTESDVGRNRAQAVRAKLQELNGRCELTVLEGPVTDAVVTQFRIIVLTDNKSRVELTRLCEAAHAAGVAVIAADCWGVFGYCFVDLGTNHEITDRTGERPKTGYLASFSHKTGMCVCIDRHDLEDGMVVRLTELVGFDGSVNGREFKVSVLDPFIFSIGNAAENAPGDYVKAGLFEEVKQVSHVSFESFATQLSRPLNIWEYLVPIDHSKMMSAPQHMLLMLALLDFRAAHGGALPRNHDMADTLEVLQLARNINAQQVRHVEDQIDESLLTRLAKVSRGDLGAMAATFGGVIAQEVIKASSGKYMPIRQWCFFDAVEVLPATEESLSASSSAIEDYMEEGTRYDGQIAVFGKRMQQTLLDLRYFLVGAGAIGCEMLKNWAVMGMGCGPKGQIVITDNDIIEISNLNRQFLYRSADVSHSKSETAARAVLSMNPHMRVKAYTTKVCPETEDVFNDEFWSSLTGVCNALDNIHARLYVDSKCVFYGKSLLESGTLGTKGNTQVMVPHLTQTYGETTDPEPKEVAKCLLHSFPSNIEHCLQWARELLFEGEFVVNCEEVNAYITKGEQAYISSLSDLERKKKLEILAKILLEPQRTFDDCVEWARLLYETWYVRAPAQLLHTFPLTAKDSAGQPFWQGTRRPPKAVAFNPQDEAHVDFIVASAHLRAYTLGIIPSELKTSELPKLRERAIVVAAKMVLPPWQPQDGVKIAYDPDKEKKESATTDVSAEDDRQVQYILSNLPSAQQVKAARSALLKVLDFEKDDDRNFHIDFVHSSASLRAVAYDIPVVPRLQAKLIAGKIIPAIVTTTALVAGLVCLELFKLVQNVRVIGHYRNAFCNLAIPLFNLSEPVPPVSHKFKKQTFTTWDSVVIKQGDMTVAQLIAFMRAQHHIDPFLISLPVHDGAKNLFMAFGDFSREKETLISVLVQEHMKLDPLQRCVKLIIAPQDDDEDDAMDMKPDDTAEDYYPPVWFYFR